MRNSTLSERVEWRLERGVVSVGLCLRPSEDVVSIIKQFNLVLCEVLSNVFGTEKWKQQKTQTSES